MMSDNKKLKFGNNDAEQLIPPEPKEPQSFLDKIKAFFTKKEDVEVLTENYPSLPKKNWGHSLPENASKHEANLSYSHPGSSHTAVPLDSPFASASSYISKETVVEGNIKTDSSIKVGGILNGDLNGKDDVIVAGQVDGQVTCMNLHLQSGIVKGNVKASAKVTMDGKSMILGDLIAGSDCNIDGRIKGSIQCQGTVFLRNNAIVHGNITAQNFDAQKGAVINGHVSIIASDKRSEAEIFALPDKSKMSDKQSGKQNNKILHSNSTKNE